MRAVVVRFYMDYHDERMYDLPLTRAQRWSEVEQEKDKDLTNSRSGEFVRTSIPRVRGP